MKRLVIGALALAASVEAQVAFVGANRKPALAIEPLATVGSDPSLAVFRIEASLPAGVADHVGGALDIIIESELVPGAVAAQTEAPLPRAHLKLALRPELAAIPELRYQRAGNRWISPWVVAISDPRASIRYVWPAGATDKIERPQEFQGKSEADGVYEMYTAGRFIRVRPDAPILAATPYAYLGEAGRMEARVATIMADTVRIAAVRVAPQNPAIASGMLQETTYLHSGEVETSAVDLDAGGRAGWNVTIDRTYRSRTIGGTAFGIGWDSSLFRRIRRLANGDVEYRDGAGEVWTFTRMQPPEGLNIKLSKTPDGWRLVNQKGHFVNFDNYGRIVSESDEFYDPSKAGSGNIISYFYGPGGRLAEVIDPVGRATRVEYDAATGLIDRITDWRGREIRYAHVNRNLTKVELPDVVNVQNQRPRIEYTYQAAGNSYNDAIEIAGNLETIKDPREALTGGTFRIKFHYANDRVTSQTWGTGETATFTAGQTTDALGQVRTYVLDGPRIKEERAVSVAVWGTFGVLPATLPLGAATTTEQDHVRTFAYDKGMVTSEKVDGIRETTTQPVAGPLGIGFLVGSSTTRPLTQGATPITRTMHYQPGTSFLEALEEDGKKIESKEPHRGQKQPSDANDSVQAKRTYDDQGRLKGVTSSGGTDPATTTGTNESIEYFDSPGDPPHKRGLPKKITRGALFTEFDYPDADHQIEKDSAQNITATTFDAWHRPVKVQKEKLNDGTQQKVTQEFFYDATGRLDHIKDARGTTEYRYDVMGRRIEETRTGVHVPGGKLTTKTKYEIAARRITVTSPSGGDTITTLDHLGRAIHVHAIAGPGSSDIHDYFAYDLDGNRVYQSDSFISSATAYDPHGRAVATRYSDGTMTTTEYDTWSVPKSIKQFSADPTPALVSEETLEHTDTGKLRETKTLVDAGVHRVTKLAWDGAGRTTGVETAGRASTSLFDEAGRLLERKSELEQTKVIAHDGALPAILRTSEKSGPTYQSQQEYNALGQTTRQLVGPLEWKSVFDNLGNVTSAKPPARPETTYDTDSRGAVKSETKPDGATSSFNYSAGGTQNDYTDPTQQNTNTSVDLLDRPLVRTYPDGTTERVEYEGRRIKSVTDRRGRKQIFGYNGKGQLETISDGSGVVLDHLKYDSAGRLVSWMNARSEITWSDFDAEGRPKRTSQKRFASEVTLPHTGSPPPLDEFTQEHRWNEHGERIYYSMPGGGVHQKYDAAGNIIEIRKDPGVVLMTADYRNAGRPNTRTVFAGGSVPIVRTYEYHPTKSLLSKMEVSVNGVVVAGSEVDHDGLQVKDARLLGVSGGARTTHWTYDDRSRLADSTFGVLRPVPPSTTEILSPADFRAGQDRTPRHPAAPGPPSLTVDEDPGQAHKIAKVTQGPKVYPFNFDNGPEVVDDGRFTYTFDAKGRLIAATEKLGVPLRRVVYAYNGSGRVVGRRAEYSNDGVSFQLETRPAILAADGLPAETTFVWDPISDRLILVAAAGTGAVLKQIIHGGQSYDDPLETTSAAGPLYPIYDEAAAGSLEAVINRDGQIVSRAVDGDPYGSEPLTLAGPAIDRVSLKARNAGGTRTLEITVGATESILPASIAAGVRLGTSTHTPTLVDSSRLRWTLTESEVNALLSAAPTLSIAVTDQLRATAWPATQPFLPAPDWATAIRPIYASPSVPFEIREPASTILSLLSSLQTDDERESTLYQVDLIALLASAGGSAGDEDVFAARMHAHPFTEPLTGLDYVRTRWYQPVSGTWVSPDPRGYADSSNLYAFCGGDPINRRDPTGEDAVDDKVRGYTAWYVAQREAMVEERRRLDAAYKAAYKKGDPDAMQYLVAQDLLSAREQSFGGFPGDVETYMRWEIKEGNTGVLSMSFEELYAAAASDDAVRGFGAAAAGSATAFRGRIRVRGRTTTPRPAPRRPGQTPASTASNAAAGAALRQTYAEQDPEYAYHRRRPGDPINADKANTMHNGIRYTPDGYPDFEPVAVRKVQIQQTGNRTRDFRQANIEAGLGAGAYSHLEKYPGHTWHHHQDKRTMLLVPTKIHDAARHTGGVGTK
jgi:RHS repeat-associated protein